MNVAESLRTPLPGPERLWVVLGHRDPPENASSTLSLSVDKLRGMTTKTATTLTSAEVCELTGLSYRRLDHWTRSGRLTPIVAAEGPGSQRLYSPAVVAEIRKLLKLIDACPMHSHRWRDR